MRVGECVHTFFQFQLGRHIITSSNGSLSLAATRRPHVSAIRCSTAAGDLLIYFSVFFVPKRSIISCRNNLSDTYDNADLARFTANSDFTCGVYNTDSENTISYHRTITIAYTPPPQPPYGDSIIWHWTNLNWYNIRTYIVVSVFIPIVPRFDFAARRPGKSIFYRPVQDGKKSFSRVRFDRRQNFEFRCVDATKK